MPKSKNQRKKNKQRRKRCVSDGSGAAPKRRRTFISRLNAVILWLAATGLLAAGSKFAFTFFTGDVELRYLNSVGRGYEFKLTNNSSTAQVIESFRVVPDLKQQFVFKITGDVYGSLSPEGVSIPGGNKSYVPAYEFKGIDGYVLQANSSIDFRIPPLVAREYMAPESMVVDLEYKTRSANSLMHALELFLEKIRVGGEKRVVRYLVAENYWTPIPRDSSVDAVQAACRDDDTFGKSFICSRYVR